MVKRIKGLFKKYGFTIVEVLLVVGVFSLIVGVSLTLLTTGKLSVDTTDARIEAAENARTAMSGISKELRLSNANKVYIYNNLFDGPAAFLSGPVVYFQIPVGSYAANLTLNEGYIVWGDEDTEDDFIYYYLDSAQLFKGTCASAGGYTNSDARTLIAQNISLLNFSRVAPTSDLITIEITGTGKNAAQTQLLNSRIKLRN